VIIEKMNIFVVEDVEDLRWLRLYSPPSVQVIFYDIVRSFEPDDFPKYVTAIHLRYCMVQQNFSCLPATVTELGFYHNMDQFEELDIPETVKSISFSVYVGQRLLDNLPPWLKKLAIYYKSCYQQQFNNLPVGLEFLYFEYSSFINNQLNLLPCKTSLIMNSLG
jgi:hypothetical protein